MKIRIGAIPLILVASLVALAGSSFAAEPRDLLGRWATDPSDCADSRYVWVFAEERAALVINNAPVGGWRRAEYRGMDGQIVAVIFGGTPHRELLWRLVKDGEIVAAEHRDGQRPVQSRSFQSWRRCPN
jgi:hypothetical protein